MSPKTLGTALVATSVLVGCTLITSLGSLDEGSSPAASTDGGGEEAARGSSGATSSSGGSSGSNGGDGAPPSDSGGTPDTGDEPRPKFTTIFVSSAVYPANLGGLEGADQKCSALAQAAGLGDRGFVAILSVVLTNARDRFQTDGPIALVGGTVVANSSADLWDGALLARINHDEYGATVNGVVWTGTDSDGITDRGATGCCGGWTSTAVGGLAEIGRTDRVDVGWISAYDRGPTVNGCDNPGFRIYCVGPR